MTTTQPIPTSVQTSQAATVIEVQGLHKRYGTFPSVQGIDFAVQRGEIFGLIGPDGAGKTTTFQILSGVMAASQGDVQVLGCPPREARLHIGYLTQQFSLYLDLSIDENLRYSAGLRQVKAEDFQARRQKYLNLMDLAPFHDRLAGQLSGGMKQKLALCCALIAEPQVLLLDEPTTGVDPVSRREFWDLLATIAHEGVTIVVATPYLDEAERCHRIALLYEGQIQQIGTLAELRRWLGLERLEIRTSDLQAAEQALQASREKAAGAMADVQSFGDRLDVLVQEAERDRAYVEDVLAKHDITYSEILTQAPTLENVFVSLLRQQGSDPPYLSFPRASLSPQPDQSQYAIQARGLTKIFGSFTAVKGVDLQIRYGEIYGLLGANGAGKTTTIKMLCGLLPASQGDMQLGGEEGDLRSAALRQRIGYMSQKFTLYDDLTIVENLNFYCGVYGIPLRLRQTKIRWVLETCGLVGQERRLTGSLPGGWKQRVAFGASVMHEPQILFLDEPTSGVDPLARRQFWRLIRNFARHGTAVLVTTHYLEEAENCHRMGFMVAGEVVTQGSPSQIKEQQPGQLVEILTPSRQQAATCLKAALADWRVSLFGERLHVVLDDSQDQAQLHSILQQNQIEIQSLRSIPFSLEDAFIGIVQRANQS
jgi:ABC-2 type transport system ATP-binding protein